MFKSYPGTQGAAHYFCETHCFVIVWLIVIKGIISFSCLGDMSIDQNSSLTFLSFSHFLFSFVTKHCKHFKSCLKESYECHKNFIFTMLFLTLQEILACINLDFASLMPSYSFLQQIYSWGEVLIKWIQTNEVQAVLMNAVNCLLCFPLLSLW